MAVAERDARPNFFLLGAAKSGTTTLYAELVRHPDVCFSRPKEPVFFEWEYEEGPESYIRRHFAHWAGEPAVGEGRVYNLYLPFVPARIREVSPGARLIAILRDPVSRAYSHWWHRFSRGHDRRSFASAVAEEWRLLEAGRGMPEIQGPAEWAANRYPGTADPKRISYLHMGCYAEQLGRYADRFGREALTVLFFDDLRKAPDRFMARAFDALGLEPVAGAAGARAHNASLPEVKSRLAFEVERLSWYLRINGLVPKGLKRRLRGVLGARRARRPPLDPGLRRDLAAWFDPEDRRLAAFLGASPPWRAR